MGQALLGLTDFGMHLYVRGGKGREGALVVHLCRMTRADVGSEWVFGLHGVFFFLIFFFSTVLLTYFMS